MTSDNNINTVTPATSMDNANVDSPIINALVRHLVVHCHHIFNISTRVCDKCNFTVEFIKRIESEKSV